ncbi:linear amide C-N hydrolase [Vibrio parahaemolyticus]|nr:linear amide C-N hydrolase [Vibrio parahaemolyticus]
MAILKNEPLYSFSKDTYCKPRHIIVEGSYEEIGYDLAKLAQKEYGCSSLERYNDPVYGEARRDYFAKNWPSMNERAKGVRRAFGIDEHDNSFDASGLPFDLYDITYSTPQGPKTMCSGLVLPKEKTENGKSAFVGRNWDMNNTPLWSAFFGKESPEGAFGCGERLVILEVRPETGYKHILVGAHELLTPFLDGMNEKGLYTAVLMDPETAGEFGGATTGGFINGHTSCQLPPFLLETCATVAEAKQAILQSRIYQAAVVIHLLIADAEGNATIFEVDPKTNGYIFTDRKPGEPLFVTNHSVETYSTPDTYPAFAEENEHNTFNRMCMLNEAYDKKVATMKDGDVLTKNDSRELIDVVKCGFVDCKLAQCVEDERTLINTSCDLSKRQLSFRFYLKDIGQIEGTNIMDFERSDWFDFSL